MKVLFDHQTFALQQYGGISRYYYELIKNIQAQAPLHTASIAIRYSNNEYIKNLEGSKHSSFFKNIDFSRRTHAMLLVNNYYAAKQIGKQEFDIFHPTYYHTYFLKYIGNKPFVVTFLDTVHELFSNRYKHLAQDKKIYNQKKILIEKANGLIAISESTKSDLINIFDADPAKIKVIHLASSLKIEVEKQYLNTVNKQYLLFVGNRTMYKNFNFFLESVAVILKNNKHLHLVCAGGGKFNIEETELINKLGLQDKVEQHYIDNDYILTCLYTHAIAFIFPSLYEGFGIPVLEAFSCHCPCLLSDTSSLPEVGGNAAIYFNPTNSDSINYAITTVLNDKEKREELVKNGLERLKFFSWEQTANKTLELYKSLV